jgi:hypothetical protein
LTLALCREIRGGTSLKLPSLALTELKCCGILTDKVSGGSDSTIVIRYSGAEGNEAVPFRCHSFRRDFKATALASAPHFLNRRCMKLRNRVEML